MAATESFAGPVWLRERLAALLHPLVALWIFSGAVVINEPSPYELAFLLVLPVSLMAGWAIHRRTLPLLLIFVVFIPFAIIGGFQVRYAAVTDALLFQFVTIFLLFTAFWVANYVADDPARRMQLIMRTYVAGALLSAALGTLGYLGIGGELFTRFGRAKALFEDPNVYGPFLILPAAWLLREILLRTGWRAVLAATGFAIIAVGVGASFSRAAWGHLAATALLVFALVFLLEATIRQKVRMLLVAIAGVVVLILAIAAALSSPELADFIELRTQTQTYDTGETGRFGRQGYAFDMALTHPFGLGPLEFSHYRVSEQPHNTYVTVLHAYGWGGGLAFIAFILGTLWRGAGVLVEPGAHRAALIPLFAVFLPLAMQAAIIDVDHWRHFFLVAGLIWGAAASVPRTAR